MDVVTVMNITSEESHDLKNKINNSSGVEPGEEPYPDFTQITSVRVVFIVLYLLVMVLALLGNAMVCCTVFNNRKMHTAVNYYIVNLAACDFMVGAFVLPVKLLEMTAPSSWNILNDGLCTSMMYLQTIFVFASVLTLVATCLERYMAVVHPLESRMQQTKRRAKKILFVVWVIPCFVAGPFLYPSEAFSNTLTSHHGSISRLTCFITLPDSFRRGYYTFLFVFIYIIPLSFIGGTCFRVARCLLKDIPVQRQGSIRRQEANRRKVAKMVMVVVLAFALCWTPYFLVSIVTQYQSVNFMERENFFFTMLCINLFAFVNSCINPFIYAAMSSRFRHGFHHFFRYLCCVTPSANDEALEFNKIYKTDPNNKGIRRHFRCQVPMLCAIPQTSSESGSCCHSDSQQTAVTVEGSKNHRGLLHSASKRIKCKMIVQFMQRKDERSSTNTQGLKQSVNIDKTLLLPELPPKPSALGFSSIVRCHRNSVSVGDISLLRQIYPSDDADDKSEYCKDHGLTRWISCLEFSLKAGDFKKDSDICQETSEVVITMT